MKKKENYIIFSSIDWSIHWQLHHQLTTSLISAGNRVLFVDNTGIRSVNISDVSRLKERLVDWWRGSHGFSVINNKLTVYSPLLLPFPYSKLSLFVNKIIFNRSISRWTRASHFDDSIVISFLPTPLIQGAIIYIDPKLSIYYCANNMADSSISASQVLSYEKKFFKEVDIIFTAAHIIQEYASNFSEKVFYFPPGIDFGKFEVALKDGKDVPDDLKKIPGKIVGYVGSLGRVLDQDLLCLIADQCSNLTIVLIGPKYTDIKELEKRSNIILLGSKSHDQLPYYINGFDVGIVPYICNDFTEGVYPSKLNEYLAMGIPSVSTNLREVRESKDSYDNSVIIAYSAEEFIGAIQESISKDKILFKEHRIQIAESNSWETRFKGISKVIESHLSEERQLGLDWKERFNSYFSFSKFFQKFIIITFFGYLLIFHSPLFWYMGEQLIIRDMPRESDSIVVFSGDGEVSYRNLSYQSRALDAIKFYNDGYGSDIFISSGREQTISDVGIIKLFLTGKGVPETSIHILEKYPNSTYQNVRMVKQMLDDNNINSILFITSPYHSRRAVLTWKKNAPNIKIIAPEVLDTPSENLKWGISMDKMRVIVYEYAALVYNWLKGRI